MQQRNFEPIAIVGIACRFPSANNSDEFWELLKNGKNAVVEVPPDRWDIDLFYNSTPETSGKMNTKYGGFIEEVEMFDSAFFGITAKEAENMDPQQRILMEVTYEALQDAGQRTSTLAGKKVGVFIGISSSDYAHIYLKEPEQINMYAISGSAGSTASNRLSYLFDLKGPSISIDTACSSSLVATHLACQSLKLEESEMAIVGGVNVILSPLVTVGFSQAQATSPDGQCKAFDASANGMVRGEGCGVIILKKLSKAIEDKDQIYSVIMGSAVNQDGLTNGLLAPSPMGQKEVLRQAYENSHIETNKVGYIEAHGTGTILGDPIEANALGEVIGANRNIPCKIGSVKTNLGHLEAGAGIAGLIKVALAIKNKALPPSLHFKKANPYIDFQTLNLVVQDKLEAWEEEHRIAGVSSFGFGGTNCHIVLKNYEKELSITNNSENNLLILSAQTKQGVISLAESYKAFIAKNENISLEDLCYTTNLKQDTHNFRIPIVFNNKEDLLNNLEQIANNEEKILQVIPKRKRKLALVFSGMGSQQAGMGKELLKNEIFRQNVTKIDSYAKKYQNWSILEKMEKGEAEVDTAQPILFALQVALVTVLQNYGMKPDVVFGLSLGEVASAYISGALTLEDATQVIVIRNNLLCSMIGKGCLAIVALDEKTLVNYLEKYQNKIWIASKNSPNLTIISGYETEIYTIVEEFKKESIFARIVKGASAPSHSPMVEPLKEELLKLLANIKPVSSNISMYSSYRKEKIAGEEITNEYWYNNIRNTVDLVETVNTLEQKDKYVYLEISPHPSVVTSIGECLGKIGKKVTVLNSLHRDYDDQSSILKIIGELYALGFDIELNKLYEKQTYHTISTPSYPWQKERHWLELPNSENHLALGIKQKVIEKKETEKVKLTREFLATLPNEEKLLVLSNYLRAHVARVLKVSIEEIEVNQPLKNLGIGSLMGMEIFNQIKGNFNITLPISKFLKGPSINEIVHEIITNISTNIIEAVIEKADRNKLLPLSFAQQRLWFIEQFENDSSAYNIPVAVNFKGNLELEILEKCFSEIIKRHEILRTIYITRDGNSYQIILPNYDFKLEKISLLALNEEEKKLEYEKLVLKYSKLSFNMTKEVPFRVKLFELDTDNYILLLVMHHIITDGYSMIVIINEISKLYSAFSKGKESTLEALQIQYADFSKWQNDRFAKGDFDKQIDYWKKQLAELPSTSTFPVDKTRANIQKYQGEHLTFTIPKILQDKLEQLSKKEGVTLFVILLAIFKVLLFKYTGQKDLIVGTPIAIRQEPGLEKLIGAFLNMLALRSEVDNKVSFSDFLNVLSKTTLSAYDNQDLPFEKLVEIIKPERNLAHTPVFQTVVAFHAEVPTNKINEIEVSAVDIDTKTSKFDLTFSFIPITEGLKCTIEYSTEIFKLYTINRLIESYNNILSEVVANPKVLLEEINLLPKEVLFKEYQLEGIKKELPKTNVLELFKNSVATNKDSIAIKDINNSLTYEQLDTITNNIAYTLVTDFKIKKGDIVAVFSERSCELICGIFAILKIGAVYLPISTNTPENRIEYMLNDSKAKLVLTDDRKGFDKSNPYNKTILETDMNNGRNNIVLNIKHFLKSTENITLKNEIINDKDLAYIIYTSGTTGKPKGVKINHLNLLNLTIWHQETYEVTEKDKASLVANISFDASIWEIFPYLISGASIIIPDKEIIALPNVFIKWLENNDISLSFLPTPLLEVLLTQNFSENLKLRAVLTGGDKLTKKVTEALPFKIYNHYGITECTVVSTATEVFLHKKESITIGKPIYNTKDYLFDENLKPVPLGVKGELYISGLSLSSGYIDNEELTNEKFIINPYNQEKIYKTGDLAKINQKGELEFLGRIDTQVKLRGVRVELQEIENVLYESNSIDNCFVVVKNNTLLAYIISKNTTFDFNIYLKTKLPEVMLPKLIFIDAIPLTANGKVDFKKLPEPEMSSKNFVPATTEIEKTVLKIWQEVLKVEEISIEDNFFELGGHSLKAIELASKIQQKFNLELSIRKLFEVASIKELSKLLEEQIKNGVFNKEILSIEINTKDKYDKFPLTDVQQAYFIGRNSAFQMGNIGSYAYVEIAQENLKLDKFEKAINQLIARHEMLRAIVLQSGEQIILENAPEYKIEVFDLRTTFQETEFINIRETLAHKVLNPHNFPLFEIKISLLPQEKAIIHLGFDALIADALSMNILSKELSELYYQEEANLPELSLTFRDYILATKKLEKTYLYEKSKKYWLDRLETLPAAPSLLLKKEVSTIKDPEFIRLSNKLNKESWHYIKTQSIKFGLTPSIILLTLFSKVLALWSKEKAFTLNLTIFNRLPIHEEVNKIVGDFTNLLLLEVNCHEQENFITTAKRIQEQLLKDLEHKEIGGVWVLRELAKAKGLDNAYMPYVFTSLIANEENSTDKNLFNNIDYAITQTPQVWLDHQVLEQNNELVFNWDFPKELFHVEMIEEIFEVYCTNLNRLSLEENIWIDNKYELLPKKVLLSRELVNDTQKPLSNKLLHDLFIEQVKINPNQKAIVTKEESFTYLELFSLANNLAEKLVELKTQPNELVAVIMEKGWEQIVAVLAILMSGSAYLPINPEHPKERIDYLLESCEVKISITQEKWLEESKRDNITSLVVTKENTIANLDSLIKTKVTTTDLAYVIFTSGSTGQPKGVMIDHQGAVNTILDINNRFEISNKDKVLALSSLNFDLSVYDIFGILATGATIVIPPPNASREPEEWFELIQRESITVWNSVPTLMKMLVEYCKGNKERKLTLLTKVLLSGDWIPLNLPQEIKEIGEKAELISLGGATEASIWSIYYPIEVVKDEWKSIPYGKPLTNQSFYILDNNLNHSPTYAIGNIYIGGIGLAKGYWKDKEKTANSFIYHEKLAQRLYKTGDLGRYLPDGNIEFLGRNDAQVKIQGHRIELGEVEYALTQYEGIDKALVLAHGQDRSEKNLIGYITLKEDKLDEIALRAFMESKIPCYMIPSSYITLESIPVTSNGKLDKKALPLPTTIVSIEIKTVDEKIVEKISSMVREILELEAFSVEADLLSLGANSIHIVRLANVLEKEFGFYPKVSDIFRFRTVNKIAEYYENNKDKIVTSETTSINKLLILPEEREAFKKKKVALRKFDTEEIILEFSKEEHSKNYRSHRFFLDKALSKKEFGKLISPLKSLDNKYNYPSAGALYPIQIYIHVKEDGVEGLTEGFYYYNPEKHSLFLIAKNTTVDKNIHFFANFHIYEQAKFSIYFIGDLDAIEPIYANSSADYCFIEAGSIMQLLRMKAYKDDIGLCPITQLDFERIKNYMKLNDRHLFLGVMLGGLIEHAKDEEKFSFIHTIREDEEWEEITI